MRNRIMNVLHGEDGMGTLEYAIIIFIVLLIAVVFFKFRDAVVALFNSATGKVTAMHSTLSNAFSSGRYGIVDGATGTAGGGVTP